MLMKYSLTAVKCQAQPLKNQPPKCTKAVPPFHSRPSPPILRFSEVQGSPRQLLLLPRLPGAVRCSVTRSNRFSIVNPKSNMEYTATQLASRMRSIKFFFALRGSPKASRVPCIPDRYFAPRPDNMTLAVSNRTAKSSITERCLM